MSNTKVSITGRGTAKTKLEVVESPVVRALHGEVLVNGLTVHLLPAGTHTSHFLLDIDILKYSVVK